MKISQMRVNISGMGMETTNIFLHMSYKIKAHVQVMFMAMFVDIAGRHAGCLIGSATIDYNRSLKK